MQLKLHILPDSPISLVYILYQYDQSSRRLWQSPVKRTIHQSSFFKKPHPLCCNVLFLVRGVFLQFLECSRLYWAVLIAYSLYTRFFSHFLLWSNAFYALYTHNRHNPHQVILCFILLFILIRFNALRNIFDFHDK